MIERMYTLISTIVEIIKELWPEDVLPDDLLIYDSRNY